MSENIKKETEEIKDSDEEESEEEDEEKPKPIPKKTYKDYLIQLLSDPPKKSINLPSRNANILKPIPKSKLTHHETSPSQLLKNQHLNNKNNPNIKSIPDFKERLHKLKNKSKNKNKTKSKKKTFRSKLQKLYGYDEEFLNESKQVRNNKKNTNIENYQNSILKLSYMNLSRDYMATLYSNLNSIKRTSENVKPLPPINYPALVTHSCLQTDRKVKNKKSFGIYSSQKKLSEMDDYEKELYNINLSKHKKYVFNNQNDKRIMKLQEILPEYLIQALYNKSPKRDFIDK